MNGHTLLSPSNAFRWLNCPLAPRLEAQLPEKTSDYAKEGTLAHSVVEISAKKHFKKVKTAEYNKTIKKLKTDALWNDEMLQMSDIYLEHLDERIMSFENEPYIAFEVKVDISDYVPEASGRCDCVMFGGDTLIITDYKYGKGEPVMATENPQMMLYALGALKLYQPLFGEALKKIEMYIDQPRRDSYDSWSCTVQELLEWGHSIKPKANMAFAGFGEYHAGSWCKFCRANGMCKAQTNQQLSAFDDFAPVVNSSPDLLTPEQMGIALEKGKNLVAWYEAIKTTALESILKGSKIPGWKAVEGRSVRVWSDQDKAIEKLIASGIDFAVIYNQVPKTLSQLEKMLGKTKFNELVGDLIVKPKGNPTLAAASDSREEYNSAVADFAAVADNK